MSTRTRTVFSRLLARGRRRRVILVVAAALVVAAICWYIGMDTAHAVTLGVVLMAIGLTGIELPDGELPPWDSSTKGDGEGIRRDVTRLSWSLRMRRGAIPAAGMRRVHDVAARRLASFGLDIDDANDRAAIEALLGRSAYRVLRPSSDRRPGLVAVVDCLDRLDGLETARPIAGPDASGSRTDRRDETSLALRSLLERFTPAFLVPIHRRSHHER